MWGSKMRCPRKFNACAYANFGTKKLTVDKPSLVSVPKYIMRNLIVRSEPWGSAKPDQDLIACAPAFSSWERLAPINNFQGGNIPASRAKRLHMYHTSEPWNPLLRRYVRQRWRIRIGMSIYAAKIRRTIRRD